jgi:glycosyltransferase involved in cell wall biosynthesis
VAVWRTAWLATSETFIRDQMSAMRRYVPVRVGLRRVAGSLTPADLTVLGSSKGAELRTEALGSLGMRRRMTGFLREQDVALVHAHFGPDAITALPVAERLGVPLVATCHGYDVTRLPGLGGGVGWEYRRRLARMFEAADGLIAVSGFVAQRMVELGAPAHKVQVRHIGIDLHGATATDPVVPPGERSGVAFVGRLVPKKGVLDLLTAWSRLPLALRTRHPLRIIGSGPLGAELAARAPEVEGPVELLGYRSSAEVGELLDRSAVYAQPSRTATDGDAEGLGMVFLEAGLHGLPSVAYAHGGVREAVHDQVTGLLAPEGDLDALTAALTRLLTEPELAGTLGRQGRARVLSDFDIDACTGELEDFYDTVVARRPSRTR